MRKQNKVTTHYTCTHSHNSQQSNERNTKSRLKTNLQHVSCHAGVTNLQDHFYCYPSITLLISVTDHTSRYELQTTTTGDSV